MLRQSHQDFSDRLKRARLRAGFKGPADAADAFRWNKNTYKSRENGLRGIPDHEDVRDLATAFKVPFLWLLAGEGPLPSWWEPSREEKEVASLASKSGNLPMPDNVSIQVSLGDLRTTVRDALRLGGLPEAQAKVLADAALLRLQARLTPHIVHVLRGSSRNDLGSLTPVLVDPE